MKLHKHIKPVDRFWARVKKSPACWLWTGAKNNKGYGDIMVNGVLIKAHRYSFLIHKGEISKGKHILHECDNPSCVNPKHLWIGTNYDNVQDRVKKGREADRKGEKNPNAKLNKKEAETIRMLYASGHEKVKDIAKKFLVNRNVIGRIIANKQWL